MEYSLKVYSICIIPIFQMFSYMQELRKQLENQVLTIDTLQNEKCAVIERHENVGSLHHNPLISHSFLMFILSVEIHIIFFKSHSCTLLFTHN